jgi:hypothetical protein
MFVVTGIMALEGNGIATVMNMPKFLRTRSVKCAYLKKYELDQEILRISKTGLKLSIDNQPTTKLNNNGITNILIKVPCWR